jgi:hypothetical protein
MSNINNNRPLNISPMPAPGQQTEEASRTGTHPATGEWVQQHTVNTEQSPQSQLTPGPNVRRFMADLEKGEELKAEKTSCLNALNAARERGLLENSVRPSDYEHFSLAEQVKLLRRYVAYVDRKGMFGEEMKQQSEAGKKKPTERSDGSKTERKVTAPSNNKPTGGNVTSTPKKKALPLPQTPRPQGGSAKLKGPLTHEPPSRSLVHHNYGNAPSPVLGPSWGATMFQLLSRTILQCRTVLRCCTTRLIPIIPPPIMSLVIHPSLHKFIRLDRTVMMLRIASNRCLIRTPSNAGLSRHGKLD